MLSATITSHSRNDMTNANRGRVQPALFASFVCLTWAFTCCATAIADPAAPEVAADKPDKITGTSPAPTKESWDAVYIRGAKVGYGVTRQWDFEENGTKLRRTSSTADFTLMRLGQKVHMSMKAECVEHLDGQVVRWSSHLGLGPTPIVATGQVQDNKMTIELSTQGKVTQKSIPWASDYRGFFWYRTVIGKTAHETWRTATIQSYRPGF